MECEWDLAKARSNFKKHGIRFADAVIALEDDAAVTIVDSNDQEERWVTVGLDATGRVLVVVYTWRENRVRLISARQAAAGERRQYEGTQ